jgi:hypothetical protein
MLQTICMAMFCVLGYLLNPVATVHGYGSEPLKSAGSRCFVKLVDEADPLPKRSDGSVHLILSYDGSSFRDIDGRNVTRTSLGKIVQQIKPLNQKRDLVIIIEKPSEVTSVDLYKITTECSKGLKDGEELQLIIALKKPG